MSDNKKEIKENSSSKAAKKDDKGGRFSKVGKFFREYRSELKKISWPTFSEVVKNTFITLVVVAIVGIIVWLVDWGIGTIRDTLITSASKVDASDIIHGKTSDTDIEAVVSNADETLELTADQLAELLGQVSGTDAD